MSRSIARLDTYVLQDPVTDLKTKRFYSIWKGSKQNTYVPNTSTSFSNSQIQFSAPPPNPTTIIDRKIYLGIPIQITFTGNTGNLAIPLLQYGVADAFRSFPVASIIQTTAITINNTTVQINTNDLFPMLLWFYNGQDLENYDYSTSPVMQDQSQTYAELLGSVRNPMGGYTGGVNHQSKRGETRITVVSNTSTSAVITAFLIEPIFLSPWVFGKGEEAGLYGIQTLDFVFTLGDLTRAWSHFDTDAAHNITAITATITGVSNPEPQQNIPLLFFRYLTPSLLQNIPMENVYPYYVLQRYPTELGLIAAGAPFSVNSNNIQLNSIPRRIYILVRRRNQDRTFLTTDTFARIQNVQINWNNDSGLLASATEKDLYHISIKNGLCMSWNQWKGRAGDSTNNVVVPPLPLFPANSVTTTGGILCLEFGSDIGLEDGQAPGLIGTYQLQMTISGLNPSTEAINLVLYVITVSEGVMTVTDLRAITEVGIVSPKDIIDSEKWPRADVHEIKNVYGGNFWSGVKSFFSKIPAFAQAALPYVQLTSQLGRAISGTGGKIARAYGYGAPPVAGAKRQMVEGGKLISRNELGERAAQNRMEF